MIETPRLRFMPHVFSCEGYSRAEVLFPSIVNLASSMIQDMLQWGWNLDGSRMQPINRTGALLKLHNVNVSFL